MMFDKNENKREEVELYIHIPFCVKKCQYCDFLSFVSDEETVEAYCQALYQEICRTGERIREPASSIFVGGGTPSLLAPRQIETLFSHIKDSFCIREDAEISMEANPGVLDEDKLRACKEAGVNRLSIGLQSANDDLLRRLGRIHTFRQFADNYEMARRRGFRNINVDLMSGLPGQSLSMYEETLCTVIGMRPEHISSYSLIVEEDTPFGRDPSLPGQLPGEEEERKMYERTKDLLGLAGYERYEISNYAVRGRECRHNLGYWDGRPYLGLGLGASSFYHQARCSNETDLEKYLRKPYIPFKKRTEYFELSLTDRMEDYMIFGLRKMEGISVNRFRRLFGFGMREVYGDVIKKYEKWGMLVAKGDMLRLTDRGIDVSNRIFADFLLGQ